ncbi:TIGR01457 family HAD-type hydrolase [Salisediminibacterium halotolerans]|uniref:TIGR01457 family HAD-type hydrolase n=1 Tax=Salisediminibacterium halotolerans TaxID=517425 RepID=UPI000EB3012C|nr:TIGR01457 family HAD-type hydrolase [Salisediminibacterium halotolerans]RLJ75391.1 4-nitrophenyl phosphatase [Actinophytocola xinjiangensis]RPE89245.1 4-nitrophenyl phosphatase [Salisediminibacterium halotolerans]TWG36004.1 4-nitrophenyl phosphatase [Salisediminibacterium halotolerans]GEL07797.1 haloacid dehalogenase [Salisediminibacterium halotolerans]
MTKNYQGYLIDLDGTMYRGEETIDAAAKFVERLNEKNIPHLFVTNNSSRTPEQVAEKLSAMNIPATAKDVFTTSMATANYIYDQFGTASVYMIGEEGLSQALKDKGMKLSTTQPKAVVIGIDRAINYEKLSNACLAVRAGAAFISTNADVAIPSEEGLLPGNGSITSVVSVSTGRSPQFIGKPESVIVDQALDVLGTDRSETLMVGDNYDTDIMAGINAEMDTLLVHTGVTSPRELQEKAVQPTYVRTSLDEWKIE